MSVSSSTSFAALAPPPERIYNTLEAAKLSVKSHARDAGYAVSIRRSVRVGQRKDGDLKRVQLQCSQSGRHVPTGTQRATSSSKTDCPFKLHLLKTKAGTWAVVHVCNDHNHAGLVHPSAHYKGRMLTVFEKETVLALTKAGVRPSQILTVLRQQNKDCHVIAQDIYDVRSEARLSQLAGRSPLAALLNSLVESGLQHFLQQSTTGQLSRLFVVSSSAATICEQYSRGKIWFLDATYKPNRYGFSLLHIGGVTSTNMSFTLAYCFMQSEISRDYTWEMEQLRAVFQQFGVQPEVFVTDRDLALINALAMVFPHCKNVLCRWHISKNIHAKQRTSFGTQEAFETFVAAWNAVVFAKTEAEFQRKMVVLEDLAPPQVMAYLASTWLMHKEKFVTAWMQGIKHFGHVSTSRVESAHSALKKWIAVSTDNFHVVNAAIRQACSEQLIVARQHNARERAIADIQFGKSFANVMGKVAVAALKLAHQRYKMRTAVTTRCSGQFQSSMGIPCEHSWNAAADRGLQLEDFDSHWWLQAPGVVLVPQETVTLTSAVSHLQEAYNNEESAHKRRLLLNGMVSLVSSVQLTGVVEPKHIQSRGRPSGSTQRLPSAFEHVAHTVGVKGRASRRCSLCHHTGHNARRCPTTNLNAADSTTNLNTTESNQSQHYRQPISTLPKARPLKPKPKAEE